jgi:hypothetical protein
VWGFCFFFLCGFFFWFARLVCPPPAPDVFTSHSNTAGGGAWGGLARVAGSVRFRCTVDCVPARFLLTCPLLVRLHSSAARLVPRTAVPTRDYSCPTPPHQIIRSSTTSTRATTTRVTSHSASSSTTRVRRSVTSRTASTHRSTQQTAPFSEREWSTR